MDNDNNSPQEESLRGFTRPQAGEPIDDQPVWEDHFRTSLSFAQQNIFGNLRRK